MNVMPILFQGDMIRALLNGRKTQTRRVIKPQPEIAKSPLANDDTCFFRITIHPGIYDVIQKNIDQVLQEKAA